MAKPFEQEVVLDANGKPLFDAVDTLAKKIQGIQQTIKRIQQDSFKSAKDFNTTIDANVKALQKAQGQMRTLSQQDATARRQERALAASNARRDADRYGTNTTKVGYEFEREKALMALRAASSEKERVAALKSVELANARLQAIHRIEAAEMRVARAQATQNKTDTTTSHRSRLALARANADQLVRTLGTETALVTAKNAQVAAEQRLAGATAVTRQARLQNLQLANAELRAIERIAAAEARQAASAGRAAAGGAGGPPGSRLGNILTPGYAAAAFARTSVYGGAAMGAYGAFNAVQGGLAGSVEMEDQFAKLQAIANATDTQMVRLKGSILGVAEGSRYAVNDLIKMSQVLAQAGISASNMEQVLRAVNALAVASGSTPDESVQLVTSALGSFQLHASEAERVANLMTEALNRTKLTVQQTALAIQYVGATAFEQNISLEQLLATTASLAQAGVRSGSTIGTGMRQFLVSLQEPTEKLTKQLKNLGLSMADVDVSVRGLPAVLDTLREAGFGSAQAYASLELRAAAFYTVAKNNVHVSDQLQASFAYSNASIIAQERAMNSLSAQWQRFKNILLIGVSENLQGTMTFLQNLLSQISDRLTQMQKTAEQIRQKGAVDGPMGGLQRFERSAEQWRRDLGIPDIEDLMGSALNGPNIGIAGAGNGGLGTWLRNLTKDSSGLSAEQERLATAMATTGEEIQGQETKVAELDKEIIRLITQKESLRNNDVRSAAETATLTSRFVGLANQLVVTGNRYDDLLNAARRYRVEQLRLQGTLLQTQVIQTQGAAGAARGQLNQNIAGLQSNRSIMNALTPQERAALGTMSQSGVESQQFQRGYGIIAKAIERLTATNQGAATALRQIVGPAGSLAQNVSQFRTLSPQLGQVQAGQTDVGSALTEQAQNLQSLVERIGSAEGADKTRISSEATTLMNAMERTITERLQGTTGGGNRNFLLGMQQDLISFRQQFRSALMPSSSETAAAKAADRAQSKEEREARAREREADRGPRLTQTRFDEILRGLIEGQPGSRLGSGPRSRAEQDALYRQGVTRATADTSQHSTGGIVRDIPTGAIGKEAGDRFAQTIRQAFKSLGIEVIAKWKPGGPGQGTGPHVHVEAVRGQRIKGGVGKDPGAAEFKYDTELDAAQLELDKADMAARLKDIGSAMTKEAFDASVGAAEQAMTKVNEGLATAALNELANAGVMPGSPKFAAKMAQVNQAITQNIEAFQDKIMDSILKNAAAMMKSAQTAFDNAIAPSRRTLGIMQGQASGLDRYSLRGAVPDSTRALADARVAQAQEIADRARLAAMPQLIAGQQDALNKAQWELDSQNLDPAKVAEYTARVAELRKTIADLVATRDQLVATFDSEGLIPTTIGEGLQQAIAAYKELNNLNLTFAQMVNGEMLDAITTLSGALTNMFTSIMDGSRSALQAMGDFAKAIMAAIMQIVAKILATQVIKLLFSLFAPGKPLPAGLMQGGQADAAQSTSQGFVGPPAYNGRQIKGYAIGGMVDAGHNMRDSTLARVSKGEWVVRRAAVESVGNEFMHSLNRHGSKALDRTSQMPKIEMRPQQEVNVWMVKPEERPQMGPNDVLVTWQNDVLSNGESRRLIKHVAREA